MPIEFEKPEIEPISPEMAENFCDVVPVGVNLIDKIDDAKKSELTNYLWTTTIFLSQNFTIDPDNYFGFSNVLDLWKEFDRCYLVLKKRRADIKDGEAIDSFIAPDFSYTIDADVTSMVKAFKNLPAKFRATVTNQIKKENAALAEEIVKDSFMRSDILGEFHKTAYELSCHGPAFAEDPLIVEEVEVDTYNDFKLDDNGNPTKDSTDNYLRDPRGFSWKKMIKKNVYTGYIPIDKERFLYNITIDNIKQQPALVFGYSKTEDELRNMFESGELVDTNGWLDTRKDCEIIWDKAANHTEKISKIVPKECQTRTVNKVFFYYKDILKKDGDVKKYEAWLGANDTLLCIKEYVYDSWRVVGGHAGLNNRYHAIGLSTGQTIYSSYLSLNARYNQVMAAGNFESLGGGVCDKKLQSILKKAEPGKWQGIPNFNPQGLQFRAWREILGTNSNNLMKDVAFLEEKISRAVPQILSGNPTGTSADRAASTLQMLGNNALAATEAALTQVENQIFKEWSKDAYNNYILYLKDATEYGTPVERILYDTFGKEALTYQGEVTEQNPDGIYTISLAFDTFPQVDFVFKGAEDAVKKLQDVGAIKEVLGFLGQMGQAAPAQVEAAMAKLDIVKLLKDYLEALGLEDIDNYFPNYNPAVQLQQMGQQVQQVMNDGQLSKETLSQLLAMLQAVPDEKPLGNRVIMQKIKDIASSIQNQQTSKNKGGMM